MTRLVEPARHSNETYNAVMATYKVMHRKISEMLSEEGLTQPQFQVLRIVAKVGATPMRGISDEMLVTPANITGIIDRLESKGLIERMVGQGDRRATIIELTSKGRAVQDRVAVKYGEFMQKVLQAFTTDEQRILSDLLMRLQREMSGSKG